MEDRYVEERMHAENIAFGVGGFILIKRRKGLKVSIKENGTPVSDADVRANEIIVDQLRKRFPKDGIVSEELEDIAGERVWYIDPIDGTKGYVSGKTDFAVHIGLCEGGEPVLGVVYQPVIDAMYIASKGFGAIKRGWTNNAKPEKRLDLSQRIDREPIGIISYGRELEESALQSLGVKKILRNGSEGVRVTKIAEGIADVRISDFGCGPWDVCAPHAILKEAGGVASYVDGKPLIYDSQRVMRERIAYARNEELLESIIEKANRF